MKSRVVHDENSEGYLRDGGRLRDVDSDRD